MSTLKVKIFAVEGVQLVSVAKSHLTIGAGSHCEIRPTGDGVATEHFRIWSDGDHLWGQDLGSGYATYMNGQVLQPMRPFLFRETDMFRIGESGVSFSCQVISDGAPRVQETAPKVPGPPVASESELKKVEQENEKLAREVLNLRHQLKRANSSNHDEDEEISEVKRNALQEINAMKDMESRRFDKWKTESVEEVERVVINLMHQRQKSKLTPEEISHDVSVALRSVLLGQKFQPIPYQRKSSSGKILMAILLSAAVCAGYMYRSKLNVRRPAAVLYVPPVKQELSSVAGKPADSHAKNKKSKNK